MSAPFYAALGTICAAIITSVFVFINLINSKEQKTSEFRQDWINALRQNISEFTAVTTTFASMMIYIDSFDTEDEKIKRESDFYKENIDIANDITKYYNNIQLYVNPIENRTFLSALSKVHSLVTSKRVISSEEITEANKDLVTEAQSLLKSEWKRVKRGEMTYRVTKLGVFALFAFLTYTLFSNLDILALLFTQKQT
ncbi:hypothetical protein [Vibrio parahaemolyticus]|uniref:hypothetical protein n=1 Tax=Vibrio parahaemolyticus TaxID=670 RepID=UPI00084A6F39|nr:hypothetical protein [Vibrio parahaemolyticus]ELJ8822801.1 hypothetical protein [Vibrio parahaemolyticus]ELJ8846858.1 hypothetical protein [Vibrio parahaemolyticus]MBO0170270.1 hypothetical protein [Vibrio parahaemolyticus]MDF4755601.1 hypothetical protein [Vibrio parahaemolyticus]MDF4781846.1 hypothetical protein [Vibrio parahaemolyticus]